MKFNTRFIEPVALARHDFPITTFRLTCRKTAKIENKNKLLEYKGLVESISVKSIRVIEKS